jgi:hypothetical protein
MSAQAWIVGAIVLGAVTLFASERLRFDVVGVVVLGLLMTLGILTPAEGLSGFSNEATVVVAAMFALNAGVVGTGGLDPLIRVLAHPQAVAADIRDLARRLSARRVREEHRAGGDIPAGRTRRLRAQQDLASARADADVVRRADGGVCTLLGTRRTC